MASYLWNIFLFFVIWKHDIWKFNHLLIKLISFTHWQKWDWIISFFIPWDVSIFPSATPTRQWMQFAYLNVYNFDWQPVLHCINYFTFKCLLLTNLQVQMSDNVGYSKKSSSKLNYTHAAGRWFCKILLLNVTIWIFCFKPISYINFSPGCHVGGFHYHEPTYFFTQAVFHI